MMGANLLRLVFFSTLVALVLDVMMHMGFPASPKSLLCAPLVSESNTVFIGKSGFFFNGSSGVKSLGRTFTMPEDTPPKPVVPERPAPVALPAPLPALNEEFGTAKKNLPSVRIIAIVIAVTAFVIGIVTFVQRPKPQGSGSIDDVVAVEIPDQSAVLVGVNVTLVNTGKKPLWIKDVKATLKTASGEFSDVAASAVDFDRYFQAFPKLKEHTLPSLAPETKIPPGGQAQGTVVVSFPVTQDGFDKRQSLSVVIQPYDHPLPVILTK
jgi:hypothetical protein